MTVHLINTSLNKIYKNETMFHHDPKLRLTLGNNLTFSVTLGYVVL